MTQLDAYEDDMGRLRRMSEHEVDRLLAGKQSGDGRADDLAAFAGEVRETFLVPPDESTAIRQLAAIAEAVRVTDLEQSGEPRSAEALRERRFPRWRGAMTRFRRAGLVVKLAALTSVAALATGGLAAAGVISLPDLPGQADDTAESVHDALEQGADPSAAGKDAAGAAGKPASQGDGPSIQQNGAEPDPQRLQEFGDSVSDRASGGEPQEDGRAFGESVSEEAQQLVPRPTPQQQAGRETGEQFSEQGGETGDQFSEQGQQTGDSFSQGGQDVGDNASGGRAP